MFENLFYRKSKVLAVILALCLVVVLVPTVFAQGSDSSSPYTQSPASGGFVTLDEDGGTLMVGTARIPQGNSEYIAVKYIYSDNILLNEKSVELIRTELKNCGITISQEMMVSDSDIPANLIGKNGCRAIFACGSQENPTELKSYTPAKTVERSFKLLYPAYNFNISEYASMKTLFDDSETVTLSEDGTTAYCSVVMDESYTEKIINGKPVTILMINSEYKYTLRAPKITFKEDETYVTPSDMVSPGDVTSSDVPESTTATSEPTSVTEGSLTAAATVPTSASTTEPSTSSTTTSATTTSSTTVSTTSTTVSSTQPSLTAAATAEQTTSSKKSTTSTSATTSTTVKSTAKISSTTSNTAKSTVKTSSTTKRTTTSSKASTTKKYVKPSVSSTTTTTTSRSNPVFNRTTINSLSSERGIVNTRRLPLNIRSGPGTNYMVVTVLPKGAYVTVLNTENPDWYMVKTMGKVVGYASSEYIRIM